jgi:hypothetical protein
MALDPVTNFAIVSVSTGYDASSTSIVLTSGNGAKLPSVFSYNLVWWNSTDYPNPNDDPNVEIVRVTGRSTDTLTVTRAQEGTVASTKNTASKTYKMALGVTAKMITDIDTTKASVAQPINAQTGTTYTFVLGDAGYLVTFGSASATTVTIPTNASVAFPIGTHIDCLQVAAGKVTFGGASVTINSKASNKSISAQWVAVTLIKTATDTWSLVGDLIA